MNIIELNKGLRILLFILIVLFGNFMLFYMFINAPIESKEWLNNNHIWKFVIIGVYNISLIMGECYLIFPEMKEAKRE